MLRLEDIRKDAVVNGIEPGQVVRIVTTEPVGENSLTVYYRTVEGQVKEQMFFRPGDLSLTETGRGKAGQRSGSRTTRPTTSSTWRRSSCSR